MTATNGLLAPNQARFLTLEVDCYPNKQGLRTKFMSHHGGNMLRQFLEEAGLRGIWVYRVLESFKCSNKTAPVQVRRVDKNGVVLWLKPGGNDSGMRGTLMVTRDKGATPDEVFNKLLAHVQKDAMLSSIQPDTVDHVPVDVDSDTTLLILTAVQECQHQPFETMTHFLGAVVAKLDTAADVDTSYWLEALEILVDRDLLLDRRTYYFVTEAGQALLTAVPSAPAPLTTSTVITTGDDVAALLRRAENTLQNLLRTSDKLQQLRGQRQQVEERRAALEVKMAQLCAEAQALVIQEQALLVSVDAEALSKLVDTFTIKEIPHGAPTQSL